MAHTSTSEVQAHQQIPQAAEWRPSETFLQGIAEAQGEAAALLQARKEQTEQLIAELQQPQACGSTARLADFTGVLDVADEPLAWAPGSRERYEANRARGMQYLHALWERVGFFPQEESRNLTPAKRLELNEGRVTYYQLEVNRVTSQLHDIHAQLSPQQKAAAGPKPTYENLTGRTYAYGLYFAGRFIDHINRPEARVKLGPDTKTRYPETGHAKAA